MKGFWPQEAQIAKDTPKIIEIVGGPNGSGKTTFAESYFLRTKGNAVFLNPDLIASGIGPLDFERASFQAGRILISEIKARIGRGESFSFESTLSGKTWATILRQAKADGYEISIFESLDDTQKEKFTTNFLKGKIYDPKRKKIISSLSVKRSRSFPRSLSKKSRPIGKKKKSSRPLCRWPKNFSVKPPKIVKVQNEDRYSTQETVSKDQGFAELFFMGPLTQAKYLYDHGLATGEKITMAEAYEIASKVIDDSKESI